MCLLRGGEYEAGFSVGMWFGHVLMVLGSGDALVYPFTGGWALLLLLDHV